MTDAPLYGEVIRGMMMAATRARYNVTLTELNIVGEQGVPDASSNPE